MKTVLTIAGSDSSGGAGIQADLKTMTVHGVDGMSAITALTAQNTRMVEAVEAVSAEFLHQQIQAVCSDIIPNAVKIGMVYTKENIAVIARDLQYFALPNIVIDPVMVATSGKALLCAQAQQALMDTLLPMADLLTPNIKEAETITKLPIHTDADMVKAAERIVQRYGCDVLIKAGHCLEHANDLFYRADRKMKWFCAARIENPNTHGTGCTLSSAIAANLALGADPDEAVGKAKAYVNGAIKAGLNLGKGNGPLNHMWNC